MKTNIKGVMYEPKTTKEGNYFYPVIFFYGSKIGSQSFYINEPQQTRSTARTIAKNYIKHLYVADRYNLKP